MKRRTFLQTGVATALVAGLPAIASAAVDAADPFVPVAGAWRTFDVVTRIE